MIDCYFNWCSWKSVMVAKTLAKLIFKWNLIEQISIHVGCRCHLMRPLTPLHRPVCNCSLAIKSIPAFYSALELIWCGAKSGCQAGGWVNHVVKRSTRQSCANITTFYICTLHWLTVYIDKLSIFSWGRNTKQSCSLAQILSTTFHLKFQVCKSDGNHKINFNLRTWNGMTLSNSARSERCHK